MSGKSALRSAVSTALLATTLAIASYSALSQPVEEITVTAAREVTVGRTSTGIPIKEISIESRVSYADLDLTTDSGVTVLQERVKDAATSACKDIVVRFPVQGSTDKTCIKHAVDDAMAQIKAAVDSQRAIAKGS